jgi:hypothetical protein
MARRSSLQTKLDVAHVATILVLIYALLGAALVVLSAITSVDPALRLSFNDYLAQMAIAVAGLSIGRGVMSGLKNRT